MNTAEVIWLNYDDFVKRVEQSAPIAGLWNTDDLFALSGIKTQLSSFHNKGVILLRTRTNKFDFEEFAVQKVNGVWKFSMSTEVLEDIKYGRGAKSEYSRGKS